jgi:GNAT superfamily N-acetyltransferase
MDHLAVALRTDEVAIHELKGFAAISTSFRLISQLNPELDGPTFRARLRQMLDGDGYRCIAAYRNGAMVGVAGFWVGTALWCGRYIEPDNVVVDKEVRSGGIGGLLMTWIEQEGARLGCAVIKLECYAERQRTRSFYRARGFEELGIVMLKPLDSAAGAAITAKNGELR